jgi:hypothetical protein
MTLRLEIDLSSLEICRVREFVRRRVAFFPGKKAASGKSFCSYRVHPIRAREEKW